MSEFVDAVMNQWHMGEESIPVRTCLRKVLSELSDSANRHLRDDRLEVKILPESDRGIWAYFPVHHRRLIARKLHPSAETRVLLVLGVSHFEKNSEKLLTDQLRDHLGFALLYLRDPKAQNECVDAEREWSASCRTARLESGYQQLHGKTGDKI